MGDEAECKGGCVYGPDAAAIGWIPYFINFGRAVNALGANNAWVQEAQSSIRMDEACNDLFDAGNPPPPNGFAGYVDFERYLDGEEFRGALYLRDVVLCCNGDAPAHLSWKYFSRGGYTPMRILWNVNAKSTLYYSQGVGSAGYSVSWGPDWGEIHYWLRFKVGALANFMGTLLVGARAPWAWLKIVYRIHCSGAVTIDFQGTEIPSQYYYVRWQRVGSHDMLAIPGASITGFLYAGHCQDAPGSPKRHIDEKARECCGGKEVKDGAG